MTEKIYNILNSEYILKVDDDKIGLKGYLVIDDTVNGLSCGGIRIKPDLTQFELQNLAKTMSLKQAFVGLPRGGGRGGIVADYNLPIPEKQRLLNRYGEIILDLIKHKKHLLAPDVGSSSEMIRNLYRHLGEGVSQPSKLSYDSGFFTSVSVYHCTKFCADLKGLDISKASIAIEGFGKVGIPLAQQFYEEGYKIVALSNMHGGLYNNQGLNIPEIISYCQQSKNEEWILSYENASKIRAHELPELPVDILCPCATDSTIHSKNVHKVKAKVVCAGANDPVTFLADEFLHKNDILYFPDFITNCGGVLGNSVQYFGLQTRHLRALIQNQVFDKLRQIYELSEAAGRSPREVAIEMTEKKLQNLKVRKEQKAAKNSIMDWGLKLHRKGLIPKIITRWYGKKSLAKMIMDD